MIFKNSKLYDILKWVGMTVLPALGVFFVALGDIWNISSVMIPVGATCTALGVLLSTILGISSIQYQKKLESGVK